MNKKEELHEAFYSLGFLHNAVDDYVEHLEGENKELREWIKRNATHASDCEFFDFEDETKYTCRFNKLMK
jgi:hypothetical protein